VRKKGQASTMDTCHACDKNSDLATLHKCPVCFKLVCEEHAHLYQGRPFCSRGCATYHFFPDEDEE